MTQELNDNTLHINQRKVLNELINNTSQTTDKAQQSTQDISNEINMDFGKLTINGVNYDVSYSYKGKNERSKERSFNEQLYSNTSKILTASIISMYFGKVDVNSVTLSLVGYLFGERIFPILVTNYSLNYAYKALFN